MSVNKKIIEIKNVDFIVDKKVILEDISFVVQKGEYLGMVGPNGGGKSTLIKIILGLQEPTKGEVKVFGKKNKGKEVLSRIGYIPQRISQKEFLFPATVKEVVTSGLSIKKGLLERLSKKDKEHIKRSMKITGVGKYTDRMVDTLSGGEKQRVFISRALVSHPDILILDEPTVGVDLPAKQNFYNLLKGLNEEMNITIILVSHDMDVVTNQVQHLLCLNKRMVCHGASEEVLDEKVINKLYGSQFSFVPHKHY